VLLALGSEHSAVSTRLGTQRC